VRAGALLVLHVGFGEPGAGVLVLEQGGGVLVALLGEAERDEVRMWPRGRGKSGEGA